MSAQKFEIGPIQFINPAFVQRMESELVANQHQGNWGDWKPSVDEAQIELIHHQRKLVRTLETGKKEAIAEHAADLANICMKIYECFGIEHDDKRKTV